MADEQLTDVQPGDLITAKFINLIIKKLKDLEAALGGEIKVPTFFGQNLLTTKNLLSAQGSRLVLSTVRDAAGLVVNANDSTQNNRIVIGQVPPPGARVVPNTPVFLLVSATVGTTPTPLAPKITGFSKTSVNIGDRLDIFGTNFLDAISQNTVTFDGALAPPTLDSTSQMLSVIVPTNIPGAPTSTGQQKEVSVRVETIHGSDTLKLIVLPPLAQPNPAISTITPVTAGTSTVRLGAGIRIVGSAFGDQLSAIRVFFGGQPLAGVTPTADSNLSTNTLVVTVPSSLPGLDTQGSNAQFGITVQVGSGETSRTSPPFPLFIWRL
ncbi:PASTA domain-containing protein [Pyxidicoccus sp. MSG2]|uniref:PASTA domain-containing protein n=1 Tax=Pyxidicoccus sp. MSG2 TaxID=2996790 RepID=UPI00226E4302|nr:PASTA domain-containing protein [Pyxidicoccus sp. MSG2]MCY1022079.1 PASTA domain-containing protein [Pyxidicoccus sp. MSG2]